MAMQDALKDLQNYDKEIKNDPLKLLESVAMLMHTPMRAIYSQLGLIESLARLINMRQYDNEDILSYLDQFKQAKKIVKSLMGGVFLNNFTENTPEFKTAIADHTVQLELKSKLYETFTAEIFLREAIQ